MVIDNKTQSLEEVLKDTLSKAESIDIHTAYFYFSGFSRLANELKDKKIRILVGQSIGLSKIDSLSAASKDPVTYLGNYQDEEWSRLGRTDKCKRYTESFIQLFNKSALSDSFDSTDSQYMQRLFEDKLEDGTLEIRMSQDSHHGKAYILKNKSEFSNNGASKGVVLMGSSNFTFSGLFGQGELNERFDSNEKYEEYSNQFDESWNDSKNIDIHTAKSNRNFFNEIKKRLWIHSTPEPYKIFIRILHELYNQTGSEDIKMPSEISGEKFFNFRYQVDAIREAIDCIKKNNGVIIADVVGLGKSIIASSVAHNLDISRTVIVAPPHLQQQWEEYVQDFGIRGALVKSSGKIDELYKSHADDNKETLFIIDEAHRYRNEQTNNYQYLHQLTRSNAKNKVILLTATPYNNKPQDLFAMVKLFQTPNRSTIHSVDNLSIRFRELIKQYEKLAIQAKKKMTTEIEGELKQVSTKLRSLIAPVIIRRSRIDLEKIKEYADDLKRQKISFPKVVGPELVEYDLGSIREGYIETLSKLAGVENGFIGAKYMPTAYLINVEDFLEEYGGIFDETNLQTTQKNLASFMRRLLVMRFESSKFAFQSTLNKMINSLHTLIEYWDKGYVPISKKSVLPDFEEVDEDLLEELENNTSERDVVPVPRKMFNEKFIQDIQKDFSLLKGIRSDWFPAEETGFDPKLECVVEKISDLLKENKNRKIVIFSSFADTSEWVQKNLKKIFPRTTLYTGKSSPKIRKDIKQNFDASLPPEIQKNDYDIIVATDALSEGFNLHRAGVVINYDIPYNPTRVVQRIGRINRINKKVYDKIYIFNFLPTDIGAEVTKIKTISTLKMLLINSVIGSDTKTLTPDEDLKSYFKQQYVEADMDNQEASWDNEYRNIYYAVKHDTRLINEVKNIPERTRIVRTGREQNVSVSFAKRGNGVLFAIADEGEETARLAPPEEVLKFFKADIEETSSKGDSDLDAKFQILRDKIKERHPLPKKEKKQIKAIDNIKYLIDKYEPEKDYLHDLLESVEKYDDLSDGELKFLANIKFNGIEIFDIVKEIKENIPEKYISVIKERAESIDRATEIIMFTEGLRK